MPTREELLDKIKRRLEEMRNNAQASIEGKMEEIVHRHSQDLEKVKERFLTNVARTSGKG